MLRSKEKGGGGSCIITSQALPNNSLNPTAKSESFIRKIEGLIQYFRGRVNSGVRFLLND